MRSNRIDLLTLEEYIHSLHDSVVDACKVNVYNMYNDEKGFGQCVQVVPGKYRIYPGTSFNPAIYRGENKNYDRFIPGNLRPKSNAKRAIDTIKHDEFCDFFKTTPYYQCFTSQEFLNVPNCIFDLDIKAIAQHFGFSTGYLDFTTDLAVALFFAYTKYANGEYFPVNFDIDTGYEPFLFIGNLKKIYDKYKDNFVVVGFQPLLRPTMQKALALDISDKDNEIRNEFTRLELPKDNNLAVGIYYHFKWPMNLFPPDTISEYSDRIKSKYILNSCFEEYCKRNHILDKDTLHREIEKEGYEFINTMFYLSDNDKIAMQKQIYDNIIPFMRSGVIGYRKTSPAYHG